MQEYPETHQQGAMSLENIPKGFGLKFGPLGNTMLIGDFSIQIAEDGRVWVNFDGVAFLRFKPTMTATEQKVYICPEHCSFSHGEDGCGHNSIDETARYEKEGDYPLCPLYTEE